LLTLDATCVNMANLGLELEIENMKLKFTLSIFGLCLMTFVLMSNSGGRAAGVGEGNTGAPGDNAKTCATCHMGGNFGTSIDIQIQDDTGAAITEYIPGNSYQVVATVNTATAPSGYGLQLVSLIDANQTDTEGLSDPSVNAQLIALNGRNYLEQKGMSSLSSFTANWTAPAESSGQVTFYASGHAANGNSASSGDESALGAISITEMPVAIEDYENLGLTISPNPVVNLTTITLDSKIDGKIELFDISGKMISSSNINSDQYTLDMSMYSTGLYFVKLTDQNQNLFETQRIVKK